MEITKKQKVAEALFQHIFDDIELPDNIKEDKDYKILVKEVVKDFPLQFKTDASYKKFSFRTKGNSNTDIIKKLESCIKNLTFYSDKIFNPNSQTKYPLLKAIELPKGYLSSSLLKDEELYDFVGNAADIPYYKMIKILIKQKGNFLNEEYNIELFTKYIQEIILEIEKWFNNFNIIDNLDKPYLDTSTTKILFPYEDSYISVSPAHSLGMVAKVIKTNQEITFDKNKDKNSFIKQTTWSSMIGKIQNMSLNAPASKKGIFLADAPNYNKQYSKEIFLEKDLDKFILSELKFLLYKDNNFKDMILRFYSLLKKLIEDNKLIVSRTIIEQDKQILIIFKYFIKQQIFKNIDNGEIISSFIDSIFNLKVESFNGIILDYKTLDMFYDLLFSYYEKEILDV